MKPVKIEEKSSVMVYMPASLAAYFHQLKETTGAPVSWQIVKILSDHVASQQAKRRAS